MENCRNCIHAEWYQSKTGRRDYRNYVATCNTPITLSILPASAWEAKRILESKRRNVASRENEPLDCNLWSLETRSKK